MNLKLVSTAVIARQLVTCALVFIVLENSALASTCKAEEFENFVSGKDQCLVMNKFGQDTGRVMLIWVHGDLSSGGHASYHFPLAKTFKDENPDLDVLSIALVRPGYSDGQGRSSTVHWLNSGRRDHYTRANVAEVAAAIERLKKHYKPSEIVLIGHSGGAATTAVILGMFPGLVSRALLVACPCDLVAWRVGATPWAASENPTKWAQHILPSTVVHAITGERDTNTFPALGKDYVEKLKKSGVKADFFLIENAGHNSIFNEKIVFHSLKNLLNVGKTQAP